MSNRSPFSQTYLLTLDEIQPGYYRAKATNEGYIPLDVDVWRSLLFFQYEPNVYGLQAKASDMEMELSAMELLDVFSDMYRHPFVEWQGADETSERVLETVRGLQQWWLNRTLWQHAMYEDGQLRFQLPDVPEGPAHLLTQAVTQKLSSAGLGLQDLPVLAPFFENGGWPLQPSGQSGHVLVSLRLSEPSELSDVWVLETVLHTQKSANHWTPPVRKRHLPIQAVLPDKWGEEADYILDKQRQMIGLLSSGDETIADVFFREQLEDADVRAFLRDDLVRLQAVGFDVILPGWLRELKQSKMNVRVSTSNQPSKTMAGLNDLLTFKWQFSMNGEDISAEDFKRLVEEKREFIRIGSQWFRVDAHWMHEIRELMQKAENEHFTVRELLFRELPEELMMPEEADAEDAERDDPLFAFELQQSLQHYLEQLQQKKGLPTVEVPAALQAELRPYQKEGFEWLVFMREQQFGACLADDMGLGKTVQLISYLLYVLGEPQQDPAPALIICPTSVLGNWQKELARFAPSLTVYTHYQSSRLKGEDFETFLRESKPHVVLSTYGTVSQDAEFLQRIAWANVTLDEAQNIKNMQTLQSRAIRKLKGAHHIALTGTPVENRLSELWAIFDFIHRGYLGSFGKFNEQFIIPIERDESERHKEKLRAKIQPFLLRRTKRDPKLLLNLPEKQEQHDYCALTTEQAALYEGYIQEMMAQLENASGFERKGKVLKMLSKLKQLCNHPALYLKEPFEDAATMLTRSVKLERIVNMAAEIADNGEQCLIFTQYIGMGHLLQHCLSELYDIDVPFLTGSTPKNQRDQLVATFQAGEFPIFLLSLKAGGTGLNLTAANHVLHADRWWNPAVENQATDRAYRIGQTQFVQVHKFVTIGTVEEKIDQMLAQKSALSEELITSSQWLTELDDAQLRNLLTLGV